MYVIPSGFSFGDRAFRSAKLPAVVEAQVLLKAAPVAARMKTTLARVKNGQLGREELEEAVAEFAFSAGALSPADTAFILETCLAVVEHQDEGGDWFPVWDAASRDTTVAISGPEVLAMCGQVLVRALQDGVSNMLGEADLGDVIAQVRDMVRH